MKQYLITSSLTRYIAMQFDNAFWVGRNSVWVTLNGAFCREISSSVCLYLGDSES